MGDVRTFRDLDVYRNAMDLAMRLFDLSHPEKWMIRPRSAADA
jgi:hypothetical protein